VTGGVKGFDIPACVKACAPGTLSFGDRDELIMKAESRVVELKKVGYENARVYGQSELDGLRYIYVLTSDAADYSLPGNPAIPISVKAWKALTNPYGAFAAGGLLLALIINGVINARNRGLEEKYKLEE
jgi:formate dehydrogenase iron-sulfur subunit